MFQVSLNLSYRSAKDLSPDSLPISPIEVSGSEIENQKVEALQEKVNQFNELGYSLLSEVFSSFYEDIKFNFDVVYTSGVPSPYDAWTTNANGSPVVTFNLSEWTVEELCEQGLAVVIHEVSHALLAPQLKGYKSENPLDVLRKTILDEGLAHFLGFPGDRSTLIEKYNEKWIQSEDELDRAMHLLASNQLTDLEKAHLLLKSHTGPFWNKYGAISGMFRAAKTYSRMGSKGLIRAIKDLQLPKDEGKPRGSSTGTIL